MSAFREVLTRRPAAARVRRFTFPACAARLEPQVSPALGQNRLDVMPLYKYFVPVAASTGNLKGVYGTAKIGRLAGVGVTGLQSMNSSYSTMVEAQIPRRNPAKPQALPMREDQSDDRTMTRNLKEDDGVRRQRIGENVSKKDKVNFLLSTLADVNDCKEAIYGALDAWVAWEQNFPIVSVKRALVALEKEQQWHRVVQVIKWMLSKGQGATMGTYGQLIRALEMDHRAEEAHSIWQKKIGRDLHSVPWQLCNQMISIYYRNNMLDRLVKLFKGLESFDRKPPQKSIVRKVADAYEMLGLPEEKERMLEKYNDLFINTGKGSKKKSKSTSSMNKKKSEIRSSSTSNTSDAVTTQQ